MELTHTLRRNADGTYTAQILVGILRGHRVVGSTIDQADQTAERFIAEAERLAALVRVYAPQAYEG